MPQNVLDDAVAAIKRNWDNFQKQFGGEKEPEHKGDYFAHDWKPPAGKRDGSHSTPPLEEKPQRKKVARKR